MISISLDECLYNSQDVNLHTPSIFNCYNEQQYISEYNAQTWKPFDIVESFCIPITMADISDDI